MIVRSAIDQVLARCFTLVDDLEDGYPLDSNVIRGDIDKLRAAVEICNPRRECKGCGTLFHPTRKDVDFCALKCRDKIRKRLQRAREAQSNAS